MGTAEIQGDLWGQAPQDWATIQEPMLKPLHEAMLNVAVVGKGTRFLDAGCGSGGASELATERGARVSGIDAAEAMITYTRLRLPNGDFRTGDIEVLPFDDDVFDTVFAANSVQYAADRMETLRELGRVCKAGGRIVAGLFGPPEKVTFRTIIKAMAEALPKPPPGAGPFELSMPGKLEALFEEAGLTVLESGEVACPYKFADFETFWRGNLSAGSAQKAIRVIGEDKLKAAVREAIQAFYQDDGSILIQPNVFKYVVATR